MENQFRFGRTNRPKQRIKVTNVAKDRRYPPLEAKDAKKGRIGIRREREAKRLGANAFKPRTDPAP